MDNKKNLVNQLILQILIQTIDDIVKAHGGELSVGLHSEKLESLSAEAAAQAVKRKGELYCLFNCRLFKKIRIFSCKTLKHDQPNPII